MANCKHGNCKNPRAVRKTFWHGRVYEIRELKRCFPHLLYARKVAAAYAKARRTAR